MLCLAIKAAHGDRLDPPTKDRRAKCRKRNQGTAAAMNCANPRRWDSEFESGLPQQRVYKPSVPERRTVDDAVMMEWRVARYANRRVPQFGSPANERQPPHSMTSSARASIEGEVVRPS